jgi:hypothetical protein
VEKWNSGEISQIGVAAAPSEPGRPDNVKIIPGVFTLIYPLHHNSPTIAGKMPKRGAGTLANRISLLHSLVHIGIITIHFILCSFK